MVAMTKRDLDKLSLKKARKALARRLCVVRLKKLWRGASGHPPANELLNVLIKRLDQHQAKDQNPCG